MPDRVSQNKRFLRNICEKGAFERHGFVCNSVRESTLILEHFGGEAGPVHVLCWLPEETIKHLIREAPEGTRFVFVLSDADRDAAERWLDSMRSKA